MVPVGVPLFGEAAVVGAAEGAADEGAGAADDGFGAAEVAAGAAVVAAGGAAEVFAGGAEVVGDVALEQPPRIRAIASNKLSEINNFFT